MTETTPSGLGATAAVYKTQSFTTGMANLAQLFQTHPELKGVQATVDSAGHVDIVAVADKGVLRDWIRALPGARHSKDVYAVHYGHEWEEVLTSGPLTVHVRPQAKAGA
jgi:hypothetical protein